MMHMLPVHKETGSVLHCRAVPVQYFVTGVGAAALPCTLAAALPCMLAAALPCTLAPFQMPLLSVRSVNVLFLSMCHDVIQRALGVKLLLLKCTVFHLNNLY